ncbi:Zinc finger, C2H2 type family protein [Trichomonas vaginalis G3]|uniref:Zinc finger, C2H2 type family protein n=1 Tax=Trichomonas vaginalis (strain ATCC PRA-98 / G3) TaxID=412133 RepID=A2F443_TRIV3|nr:zinc finger, C2H2-type family protein [Trichomonas vaginalis G3]EAY00290.1 Zinc finger, C2H2 type family protein [Trichomonas vaginalis G3]KAI5490863.1 zinc finger, C2H2-type family protein [Trichomonas vaginalis G3]|eukprot:XP_001313219.1 Zinc finger, C2H2 type family protein [Trichomonas vaginalis G3]
MSYFDNVPKSKTGLLNIKVVDWGFIKDLDVEELRNTRDRSDLKAIIKDFLKSDSLFVDPNFVEANLVFKYFQLLQIAVKELTKENNQLREIVQVQKEQLYSAKDQLIHSRVKPTKTPDVTVIYQCPYCFKQFKSKEYLELHKLRRHNTSTTSKKIEKTNPISKPTVDINKIVESMGHTLEQRQKQQKEVFEKRFSDFENKIKEKLETDRRTFIADKFPGNRKAADSVFGNTLTTSHVPLILSLSDDDDDEYLSSINIKESHEYSSDSF